MENIIGILEEIEKVEGVEQYPGMRYYINVKPKNNEEKFEIELGYDNNNDVLTLRTFYTVKNTCTGKYDPKINSMLKFTEENIKKVVKDTINLYMQG